MKQARAWWYNGVCSETQAVVALISGPHPTRQAAVEAKRQDEDLVREHVQDGYRLADFGRWYAVSLAGPYDTMRDVLAGKAKSPSLISPEARS